MIILRYTISKEPGLPVSLDSFIRCVTSVLQPSHWRGYTFVHIPVGGGKPDFRVILTSPKTIYTKHVDSEDCHVRM